MKTQTTAVPKLFIGMDVHKKSRTVHFKTDLFDNKTVTMPTAPIGNNKLCREKFCRSRSKLLLLSGLLWLLDSKSAVFPPSVWAVFERGLAGK